MAREELEGLRVEEQMMAQKATQNPCCLAALISQRKGGRVNEAHWVCCYVNSISKERAGTTVSDGRCSISF